MGSRRICPERGHEIPRERRCGYVEQDRLASALTSCWGELRAIVGLCVAEPDAASKNGRHQIRASLGGKAQAIAFWCDLGDSR